MVSSWHLHATPRPHQSWRKQSRDVSVLSCPASLALKHGASDLCPASLLGALESVPHLAMHPRPLPGPDPRRPLALLGPVSRGLERNFPSSHPTPPFDFCLPPLPELVAIEMSRSGSRPSQPPCLRPRMPLGTAVTLVRHVLPADTQGCAGGGGCTRRPAHPPVQVTPWLFQQPVGALGA